MGALRHQHRAAMVECPPRPLLAGAQHDCPGAVREDHRGHQVVDGAIVRLERERWDLDGEEQHAPLRVGAKVIESPRQAGHPAATSQLRDRQARDVRAEAQHRDQLGIE